MADPLALVVPPEMDGERVDRFLAVTLGVSRAQARELLDRGVEVDGLVARAGARLRTGSRVVSPAPRGEVGLEPEDVEFGVLYEDRHLLVVDKPAGVVVHPGHGATTGTLAAGLIFRFPEIRGVGDANRWGLVHRLDRDTSGVMIVARTQSSFTALAAMIKERQVDRRYIALVDGVFATPTGTIDAPIGRDPFIPTKRAVVQGGKEARTHYRVLSGYSDCTLVAVRLETGRTHQIRVHMAAIDHPVVGDHLYGSPTTRVRSPRIFLHASAVGFRHPVTGLRVECEAALPADLSGVLEGIS